jgi:Flp pilus assembly protein TadG
MMLRTFIRKLRRNDGGSVAVEFALVGPLLIGMLMGVMQIGIGMQNYNALRGISADVARYAVINYQTGNQLNNSQLEEYSTGLATAAPYGLNHDRFMAQVSLAPTQRVAGARELTVRLTYNIPTFLGVFGIDEFPVVYTRPVFVLQPTP